MNFDQVGKKRVHSTYDFSTLYTSLPHNLIKDKLLKLVRRTFEREKKKFIACNNSKAFFTETIHYGYHNFDVNYVCDARSESTRLNSSHAKTSRMPSSA